MNVDPAELVLGGRPFRRRDAARWGWQLHHLEIRVRRGELRQPLRGVYIDARAPDDHLVRAACVATILPHSAAVSRATAAWLFGVDARPPGRLDVPLAVECTVPPDVEPLSRPGVRCYRAPLHGDVEIVGGLACTTPQRTAIDLLRWTAPFMGLAVADALAGKDLIKIDPLIDEIERWRGAPGIRRARRLAQLIEPLCESFGESWTRLRIIDSGFPRPQVQIAVTDDFGRPRYRLDMGWEELRAAVEYDGEEYHSSTTQLAHDAGRRRELERQYDWRVLVARREHILGMSLAFERAVGDLLGMAPTIARRPW